MTTVKVYEAICNVAAEISKTGISKDGKNQQQGYSFRGIDSVYNALSPILAKHRLCILPRVVSREQIERQTMKGGVLFYTTVHVEFDFVSAEDGSKHTISTVGEAMDSGDKSSNKAMSAAYKYAAFQAFAIPTEGDNDAELATHEVRPAVQHMASSVMEDLRIAIREADDLEALESIGRGVPANATTEQKAELAGEYTKRKRFLKKVEVHPETEQA